MNWEATSIKSPSRCTPYNLLLKKLTFNPNTIPNPRRIAFKVHNFSICLSQLTPYHQQNCRILCSKKVPKLKPLNSLCWIALLIKHAKHSTTKEKRKRDNGSPWHKPLSTLKSSVGLPFNSINMMLLNIHVSIQFIHLSSHNNQCFWEQTWEGFNTHNHMLVQNQLSKLCTRFSLSLLIQWSCLKQKLNQAISCPVRKPFGNKKSPYKESFSNEPPNFLEEPFANNL